MAALRPAFATLILFAAGRATDSAPSTSTSAPPVTATAPGLPPPFSQLQKGMAVAELRARVGAPKETKPFTAGGVQAETWSYPLGTTERVDSVPVATRESTAINPITGRQSQVPEQIFQNRTTSTTETLELLVVDERLIEWKVTRTSRTSFQ